MRQKRGDPVKRAEDKRVLRTKKNLKSTLAQMMAEMPFEKITVKEICDRAITSRITFYNYYSDKYALLEDIFQDMNEKLEEHFLELQKNNREDDPLISYQNLLDCFLDLHYDNREIMENVSLDKNTVLLLPYYHFMVDNTTALVRKYFKQLKPNYPPEKISVFIVFGIFGYIRVCTQENSTDSGRKAIYDSAHKLLRDLINSDIFTKKN